jgi:hypothetical protein
MINSDKIVDAVIRVFNLLTFLAAAFSFCAWYQVYYRSAESFKGYGDHIMLAVVLVINGGIIWKTAGWLFAKTEKIYVPYLLIFWFILVFLYLLVVVFAMGSMGIGSSQ